MSDNDPIDIMVDFAAKGTHRRCAGSDPTVDRPVSGREGLWGRGGFGLVYLARDEQLDRPVAVKVPHARLVSKRHDASAYLTETRTVANLDHRLSRQTVSDNAAGSGLLARRNLLLYKDFHCQRRG